MRKIGSLCLIVMLLLSMGVFLIFHETVKADPPADVYVDDDAGPSWYDATHVKTIQEGIDNVTASGTVYIWDGTYYQEGIIVNKSVSLIGNGTATTILEWSDSIPVGLYAIILIDDIDNINISNLRFNGSLYDDIVLNVTAPRYTNYLNIYDCLFTNSSSEAIRISSSSSTYSNYINISDNEFDTIGSYVILLEYCENATCSNNTVHTINAGILLQYSSNSVVSYNNVSHSDTNELIGIPYSTNISVHHNILKEGDWTGIYMAETDNCSLFSNTIIGFNVTDSYGMEVYDSYDNLFYNNYLNNDFNVYDDGNNTWNTTKTLGTNIIGGQYFGGNYWGGNNSYVGNDNDGDGLGNTDLPHNSSGAIVTGGDYLPLGAENTLPDITEVYPANDSTNVNRKVQCLVNVTDPDGDTVDVSFYENTTGAWIRRHNETVAGTVVYWNYTNAARYGTTYWWRVVVDEGTGNVSGVYSFTIKGRPSRDKEEKEPAPEAQPPPAGISPETVLAGIVLFACAVLAAAFVWIYYKW